MYICILFLNVRFILDSLKKEYYKGAKYPATFDHWRPQHKLCPFCLINFRWEEMETNFVSSSIIFRSRMVKNINFFCASKKLFLINWKTVFWVTEHFCIKWSFWKNAFFCPKNAFFWQKWPFDPRWSAVERVVAAMSRNFFWGGYFATYILKDFIGQGWAHGETPLWTCSI